MLTRLIRKKEGLIITTLIILLLISVAIYAYNNYMHNKKYEEQTVMAEAFLKEGNYEKAVEGYLKALSMKSKDQEALSIGLAEAYIGLNNYDKALEVLRNCYQNTSGITIKEKIEEVTLRKSDYEFSQIISRADRYNSNGEFDRSITEYEKAKRIKSKDTVPYLKIAETYIKKNEYQAAQTEIINGLAIAQNDELNQLLDMVEAYLQKQQYEDILSEAEEYISQENYEDAISKYEAAISLLPKEESAYKGLAETYLLQEKYDSIILLLQRALRNFESTMLEELLLQAKELKDEREKRKLVLSELYKAVSVLEVSKIKEILSTTFYKEKVAADEVKYYSPLLDNSEPNRGYGVMIYSKNSVYSGGIRDGMKLGSGVLFYLTGTGKNIGYYYYEGDWKNDIPDGIGKTVEEAVNTNSRGEKVTEKVITEGIFYHGREGGSMKKTFYLNGEKVGTLSYIAIDGKLQPLLNEEGDPLLDGDKIIIGTLILDNGEARQFSVDKDTFWEVKQSSKKQRGW